MRGEERESRGRGGGLGRGGSWNVFEIVKFDNNKKRKLDMKCCGKFKIVCLVFE